MLVKLVTTEKAISGVELRNSLTFEVPVKATKREIKAEVEKEYAAKILGVNTLITPRGTKHAVVTFKAKGKAADIAAKLKLV